MASAELISALRLLIAESTEDSYTDTALSDRIDAADGSLNLVAFNVWTEKAAKYAALVDITEGGSSRKNSSLQSQALIMARQFQAMLPVDDTVAGARVRIKKLTR
jgi:hypothetical protein